ncbi:fucolectin-like [Oncorhynchus masou masou]|uniref:fucolectin-like n=1 Tax=Oncorhynchus masou masou TaxID=90313 RepID=UPI00318429DA
MTQCIQDERPQVDSGEVHSFQCNEMEGRCVVVVIPGRSEYLTLCEVEVYVDGLSEPVVNVVVKGVATQSSVYGDGQANNVIDGNRESNYHKISCTHTEQETNPWWRVDLLDLFRVTAVSITNRDVVPERLDGAEIRIGNSLENNGINNPRCDVISHIPAGETNTFQCNEMEGHYVVVVIPGQNKILPLCEVEVYGLPAEL